MTGKKFTAIDEECIVKDAWEAAKKVWGRAKKLDKLSPLSIPLVRG